VRPSGSEKGWFAVMRWRLVGLVALLLPALPGRAHFASREDETCLTQMATGRQRGSPIRFVSLVGTEGSGHHLLTPVIRKIMAASLVPGQDDVDSDHETHFGFTGAGADDLLWYAFKGSNLQAFREALRKQKHGALVQQEYSFPSGDMRSVGHRFYNLTDLYQMLEASGVKQKAVIKYVRPMPQRARSVYKRWPEHCAGSLMACKAEQQAFDQLIEDHLAELDKMKVPVLRIGMHLFRIDCHQFGLEVLGFLGKAKLLPPGSPYEKEDSDETKHLTEEACALGKALEEQRDAEDASHESPTTLVDGR